MSTFGEIYEKKRGVKHSVVCLHDAVAVSTSTGLFSKMFGTTYQPSANVPRRTDAVLKGKGGATTYGFSSK